jgi:hypothetical protein
LQEHQNQFQLMQKDPCLFAIATAAPGCGQEKKNEAPPLMRDELDRTVYVIQRPNFRGKFGLVTISTAN